MTRHLWWLLLPALVGLVSVAPRHFLLAELNVRAFESPGIGGVLQVPAGVDLQWLLDVPAVHRLVEPELAYLIDTDRAVATPLLLLGRDEDVGYVLVGGRVARIRASDSLLRPARTLRASRWPLASATPLLRSNLVTAVVVALVTAIWVMPTIALLGRYNLARGRWGHRHFRWLKSLRFSVLVALGPSVGLVLAGGVLAAAEWAGRWSVGAPPSDPGWHGPAVLSAAGLCGVFLCWWVGKGLDFICNWGELDLAARQLEALSESPPSGQDEDALTLHDRRLLEGLQDSTANLSVQLLMAGVRPRMAPPFWALGRSRREMEAGPAVPNHAVVSRLGKLLQAGLVELDANQLRLTLDGLEQLELPRTLFLAPVPLGIRRSMIDAERALRGGNARDARVAAGIALEQVMKRWLRFLLSAEQIAELEAAARDGAGSPLDDWGAGALRSELIGALKASAGSGHRRPGQEGIARGKRDRLRELLEVASGLRNPAPHAKDDEELISPIRALVEARAMLDATRAAVALGEEYLSLRGAPAP